MQPVKGRMPRVGFKATVLHAGLQQDKLPRVNGILPFALVYFQFTNLGKDQLIGINGSYGMDPFLVRFKQSNVFKLQRKPIIQNDHVVFSHLIQYFLIAFAV
jgi:hypothetical protein